MEKILHYAIISLLLFATWISSTGGSPRVNYIDVKQGSLNGGTRINIFGSGFDTSLETNPSSSNKGVYFVSDFESYECDIHIAESDENQIACYTRAMLSGSYYLTLKQFGLYLDSSKYCDGHATSSNCRLSSNYERTPLIEYLNPVVRSPGPMITVSGKLYTDLTNSATASSSNGRTSTIRRVYSTSGQACELVDPDTEEPYEVVLLSGDWGRFRCLLEGTFIGYQNITFIVDQDFGRSSLLPTSLKLSVDNQLYMIQTHATVTSISPSQGSIKGGTLVTITGQYFYTNEQAPAQVWVGGRSCDVQAVSDDGTGMTCKTTERSIPTNGVYTGGRGLKFEIFRDQSNVDAITETTDAVDQYILSSTSVNIQYNGSSAVSRMSGVFIPSITAQHIFMIRADGTVTLTFNENGNNANGASQSTLSSGSVRYSNSYSLTAGQEYYFEVRHLESGGSAQMNVGVYVNKTYYTPQQISQSVTERQTIQIRSTVAKEIQTISLLNWDEQAASSAVWDVAFTCNEGDCIGQYFKLILFETSTDEIEYGIEESFVAAAVDGLLPLSLAEESVSVESTTNGYRITFESTRGPMELSGWTSNSSILSIETREITKGEPTLESFTLQVNGYISKSLSLGASANEVSNAVNGFFGARCPSQLDDPDTIGYKLAYHDMENGQAPSGSVISSQSFCGIYSTLNPGTIYQNNAEPYDILTFTHVCFAYKGPIANNLIVEFDYVDENGAMGSGQHVFSSIDLYSTTDWAYYCFDMLTSFFEVEEFVDYPEIKVSKVSVSRSGGNLLLDNIYIGSVYITDNETRAEFVKRRIPPAVTGIKLQGISVAKADNNYTITFTPHDCGNNFPLINLAFSRTRNDESNDLTEYRFGSNQAKAIVERTSAASPPVRGSFDIGFDDPSFKSLTGISATVSAQILKNELETLMQMDDVEVEKFGNCYGYGWGIRFVRPGGKYPLMTADASRLSAAPDPATVSVARTSQGGLYMDPIYADFFKTVHTVPQVQVQIDDLLSKCESISCDFDYSSSATPSVSGVAPQMHVLAGDSVTITGTGFSAETSHLTVLIGMVSCEMTLSTETEIECNVGESPSGYQDLSIEVTGKGYADIPTAFSQIDITGSLTLIDPTRGSSQGGTIVTITGTGFETGSEVSIGGSPCTVSTVSYTSISCETSAAFSIGLVDVDVTTRSETVTLSGGFEYQSSASTVTSLSPTALSAYGGETVTINGNGFGTTQERVSFGDTAVNIASWSDTVIEVIAPSLTTGTYSVKVKVADGYATPLMTVTYQFSVTGFGPQLGSLAGGTQITITGTGFSNPNARRKRDVQEAGSANNDLVLTFCDRISCNIIETNDDSVKCELASSAQTYYARNTGQHPVFGHSYKWNQTTFDINAGDSVVFSWSAPIFVKTKIGLQTGSTSSSTNYDGKGIQVSPRTSGSYSINFPVPGKTVYLNSGCMNSDCSLVMRATINVLEPTDINCTLKASVGGVEADLADDLPIYQFSTAETAVVTEISPNEGNVTTEIVISGEGFTTDPLVLIGGKTCAVATYNETSITCSVGADQELGANQFHEVKVKFDSGFARIEIDELYEKLFLFRPTFTSISPTKGSIKGGTRITIEGTGFASGTTIALTRSLCINSDISYTRIACDTRPSFNGRKDQVIVTFPDGSGIGCEPACIFTYLDFNTPIVSSMNISDNFASLQITLHGSGFGTVPDSVTVHLHDRRSVATVCSVQTLTDTMLICGVGGRFPVGTNVVQVRVDSSDSVNGKGYAAFDRGLSSTIENPATLESVSPSTGSLYGGTSIVLQGNGFVSGYTTVTIGGVVCDVQMVTFSNVTCVTRSNSAGTYDVIVVSNQNAYETQVFGHTVESTPMVTAASPTEGSTGDTLTLTGSNFGSDESAVRVSVGGVPCVATSVSTDTIQCTLGKREGGSAEVTVTIDPFGNALVDAAISFHYVLAITSVAPVSGSYGGGQNLTIYGNGFSTNTVITICGEVCATNSYSLISPTQVACSTPANGGLSVGMTACEVSVANGADSTSVINLYSYDANLTPTVSSVSPDTGGTGGGTPITITGTGFSADMADNHVEIDGSICIVTSATTTIIECTTEGHRGSVRAKVSVAVGTDGLATNDNAVYFYIDRWSSIFTWGGLDPPTTGDFVIIQKGQTVLLDTSTETLKMLLIEGGELIFDEVDLTLNAENILITDGGLLQVGTESAPFQHKATIQMHGHLRSPELPIYGAKTLGVREGTLDLHGKPIANPWTLLSATASPQDTQITVQHSVFDWQVGDEIVIATTGYRHSQRETEKREIAAVSADGYTITLTEALKYQHLGVSSTVGGREIEFRAEVGLLSRNIVFRGSNHREWNDIIPACQAGFNTGQFATQTCFQGRFGEEVGTDEFGGSIMMHSPTPNSPNISARIENVELTYVGQAFRLGRYPIHWHLMGNVGGMYVRSCAIHQSFNRAVTIHGTSHLLVEHNVVYDVKGGAIFIEDGIETNNIVQYNLALFVRQSTSLLNDDITPAAYWVTNPDNIIRHNHAAGGTHFGFWYRMHQHPDGPSFTSSVCPRKVELGEYRNNTVHSQGWYGIWIFQTYTPVVGGSCGSNTPSTARFYSLTAWRNEKGAEWVGGGALEFNDFVVVDNEATGLDLIGMSGTSWAQDRTAGVSNSMIAGHSDLYHSETGTGISIPPGSGFTVSNTTFANFNRGGKAFSISVCGDCGGFYTRFEKISFDDVTKIVAWSNIHAGVLLDLDGTLTGSAAFSTVVPFSEVMDPNVCQLQINSSHWSSGAASAICDPGIKFHRLSLNQASAGGTSKLILSNSQGNTSSSYQKIRLTHKFGYMVLLPDGEEYTMEFANVDQFTNFSYSASASFFGPGDKIIIKHRLTRKPDWISVGPNSAFMHQIDNVPALSESSRNLDWFYDEFDQIFKLQLSNDAADTTGGVTSLATYSSDQNIGFSPNIYRCFYFNCTGPVDPELIPPVIEKPVVLTYWSDPSNPCIERDNVTDTITVLGIVEDELCWVIVDVPEIVTTNLTIYGVLHFDSHDVTIKTTYIVVLGGRLYTRTQGFSYFDKQLNIELYGNKTTEILAYPGINIGAKAIACFGGCDFHGKPHEVYWTRLESTVTEGATAITLQDAVHDWEVGNQIVIATTGYSANETEIRTITAKGSDNRTLHFTPGLEYRHMGETYTIGDKTFDMRAEVGLLTRNIRIIGVTYDEIDEDAFGARVLVGNSPFAAKGWGRFNNIEFYQTGQEGWTEKFDPRFSLAYLNTGSPTNAKPSEVIGCAFHHGYSTAIGIFGANKINVLNNVVHRTIHDGIVITGRGHRVERNLVTVTLFRGSWGDRFDKENFMDWQASFKLTGATSLTLIGNTAAGSERLGFHTDGEACDVPDNETKFKDNVAHSTLQGIHILGGGVSPCTCLRNFVIYKAWDFGIYHQTGVSIQIKDTLIADSTVAYFPMITGPSGASHICSSQTVSVHNFTCIGKSDDFDDSRDVMNENTDKNLVIRGWKGKAPKNPTGGSTCVMLPVFQGGSNQAPFKKMIGNKKYPSVCGLLNITGLHAHSYKGYSSGKRNYVFYTNPANEDAFHPTVLQNTTITEVDLESKARYDRPSLSKVNPADCVDMECDAKKKVLIKDLDGGFLGGIGAIVPDAAFEWDGDSRRGLGDYRIPKTMLTNLDGSRIQVDDIIDERGIVRNSNCEYRQAWQAFDCHGEGALNYEILVIESMDGDTETRRLSPLALLGNRYIDLTNGPQDHGWCSGYTCQKRLSTFHIVVTTETHFDIYFTSYAPRHLRLRLLNVDDTRTLRVAVWYARPERLDIYRENIYIHPQNSEYSDEQQDWIWSPLSETNFESYKPAINASLHGANMMDLRSRLLFITLRGSDAIDIKTSPAIIVKLGFPAISIDDFFGENLRQNLIDFLRVPAEKVRLVEVIRETQSRKRRQTTSTETVTYTIMYSDELDNTTSYEPADQEVAIQVLNNNAQALIIAYQNQTLAEILGINATSFQTGLISTNLSGEVNDSYLVLYNIPRTLTVTSLPSYVEEYQEFSQQPTLSLLDENDELVAMLTETFQVTATLDKTGPNADVLADLRGDTSIMFTNGVAQYTNLMITRAGVYDLKFEITNPAGVSLSTTVNSVNVTLREVQAAFISTTAQAHHNDTINFVVELRNINDQTLPDVGFKGHTWKADVLLDDAASYAPATFTSGTTITYDFDAATARLTTTDLSLVNTENFHRYNLRFRIYTEPALYNFTVVTDSVWFADNFTSLPVAKVTQFILSGTPYLSRMFVTAERTFTTLVHNQLVKQLDSETQRITEYSLTANNGNTEISFAMRGTTEEVATAGINNLEEFVRNGGVQYNGDALTFTSTSCAVTVNGVCQDPTTSAVATENTVSVDGAWIYVIIGVLCAAILVASLITLVFCLKTRANKGKVASSHKAKGCMDAESSRGSSRFGDRLFLTGSADSSSSGTNSQMGDYPDFQHQGSGLASVQN